MFGEVRQPMSEPRVTRSVLRPRRRGHRCGAFFASALAALTVLTPARSHGDQETAATPSHSNAAEPSESQLADLSLAELLQVKVDTVYAASKFVQEVGQAPASVSIVTAAEIRAHGYRTLAEVLRSVRGFFVTNDRNYSYLGVRGFSRPGDYNSRVLVLVNGHRLNDTIYESALLGTEAPLDAALFDRVEVVRGPSSSLYGTSAFFAVVNVITRPGRSLAGVEVEGDVGSRELRSGRLTAGGQARGLEGLVSVSAMDAAGNRRLYYPEYVSPESDGIARNADADRSVSVFGTLTGHGAQLQGGFGSRRKVVPTGAFDTIFNDARTATEDARGFLNLQLTRAIQTRTTLRVSASFDTYAYDGTYAYEDGPFFDRAPAPGRARRSRASGGSIAMR